MQRREYPDSKAHLDTCLDVAAQRLVASKEETGIEPSETLIRAVVERTLREAEVEYDELSQETLMHNLQFLLWNHERRMEALRREGVHDRSILCPIMVVCFGALALFEFLAPDAWLSTGHWLAWLYAAAALFFLGVRIRDIVVTSRDKTPT